MPDSESDLLMQVARALRHRWAATYAPWELTPHQARTLRVVEEQGHPRLSTIAERLRISPRSATEVVDALEQAALVTRVADPTDRRAVRVALTDRGHGTLAEVTAARDRDTDDFFARLTDHERTSLGRILRKLLAD